MGQIKWTFLLLAILSAVCMMSIGISIGLRSIIGLVVSFVALLLFMGIGFRKKKKMSESQKL